MGVGSGNSVTEGLEMRAEEMPVQNYRVRASWATEQAQTSPDNLVRPAPKNIKQKSTEDITNSVIYMRIELA